MATVLVVDDDPDIRYLTQMVLEAEGHLVMTASGGADALAAVEVEVPDVILLDVIMPGLDGWAVLEQLKANFDERISTVRVVMVTSLGADEEVARGGIEGAVRYLVKPVSVDDLAGAVREVLEDEDPEPVQRLRAQVRALTAVARMEKGEDANGDPGDTAGPRLSRLERTPVRSDPDEIEPVVVGDELTATQRDVIVALIGSQSVTNAAVTLGVSRANVYASLRRSARALGIESVPELLELIRTGLLVVDER